MEVVVASHPSALDHDTSPVHPERPARVGAVLQGIADSGLATTQLESPEVKRSELALVHDPDYIELIETFCHMGGGALDRDTIVSPESWTAALTAAGGVVAAIEHLESGGTDRTGFVVARPPGHHALRSRAMGFCLFNNIAVGAALLRARGDRVAVLDWDVHHGNGSQVMFAPDPGIFYASLHQSPFYPFEGAVEDIELGAKGTTVNIPLPAGTAGDVYRRAWEEIVIPTLVAFQADWVLVSSGFDAHASDELAELRLVADDYGWLASALAAAHPPNRSLFVLEGGYDLEALRDSTAAVLRGMSGETGFDAGLTSPPQSAFALDQAFSAVSRHWPL
jgi:acetoin utilization deacetylase AcuC-like enzyme